MAELDGRTPNRGREKAGDAWPAYSGGIQSLVLKYLTDPLAQTILRMIASGVPGGVGSHFCGSVLENNMSPVANRLEWPLRYKTRLLSSSQSYSH